MDLLSVLRMLGGLGVVLGMLVVALWLVRRYDIKLPGRVAGGPLRRVEVVERLPVDGRRSVALIRRDGREHLILLAPEGPLLIETSIVRDDVDMAAQDVRAATHAETVARAEASAAAMRENFAALVEKASTTVRERIGVKKPAPPPPPQTNPPRSRPVRTRNGNKRNA